MAKCSRSSGRGAFTISLKVAAWLKTQLKCSPGREHIRLESVACELLASDVFDGVEPESGQQVGMPV